MYVWYGIRIKKAYDVSMMGTHEYIMYCTFHLPQGGPPCPHLLPKFYVYVCAHIPMHICTICTYVHVYYRYVCTCMLYLCIHIYNLCMCKHI
jgi:hypothetical protein